MAGSGSDKKIILFLISLFITAGLYGKTWVVTVNGNSLQSILDSSGAYDTVKVAAGIYKVKELKVKKPVVLTGINMPVFDGEKKYQTISVFSSDVVIEGFEFTNGGKSDLHDLAAIKISRGRNVIIRNNTFLNMFFAVYFQESVFCTVSGNSITSNAENELQSGNGIHLWKCDSMSVKNNYISGHRDGIYFEFVTHSSISANKSYKNIRYGLHFMFSHDNNYAYNTFENNGAGVAVMYTHRVSMKYNVFSHNWGSAAYGILLKEISDSDVSFNTFTSNTAAIYMEGSNRTTVKNNLFEQNGCALRIQASCDGNTISSNNFKGNTFDVTTNGSLVLNTFNGNYWDKYEGYDLNRDGRGDVPYHPVSLYSMIIERMPVSLVLMRSFLVSIMDKTEKAIPSITPENFKDETPFMKPIDL